MLESSHTYKPVEFFTTAEALWRALNGKAPDILLLDVNLPDRNGIDMLADIRSTYPETGVLVFTMHCDPFLIQKARQLGADGYLLKDFGEKELLDAMECLLRGKPYFKNLPHQQQASNGNGKVLFLTTREKEIIHYSVSGHTSEEIAARLYLSPHTVNTHRRNIYKKLNISNIKELISYAHSNGLV